MDVYKEKHSFVCTKLSSLLKSICNNITNVSYVVSGDLIEHIYVAFANGGTKCINVTGDSLLELTRDVLKRF
ncbi:MAG: hypothetical protein J6C96_04030 [Oscillospiraceae bacterium]|nr:hypothetical protein [Oscillospiraceae bacterium]